MYISQINIKERKEEINGLLQLYRELSDELKQSWDPDDIIRSYTLYLCIQQNTLIPFYPVKLPDSIIKVLVYKKDLLEKYLQSNLKDFEAKEDLYYTKLQIDQSTLYPIVNQGDNTLKDIYIEKMADLLIEAENEKDKIIKIRKRIEIFYLNEDILSFDIKKVKEISHDYIKHKKKSYTTIIGHYDQLLKLLQISPEKDITKIQENKEEIEVIKAKIKTYNQYRQLYNNWGKPEKKDPLYIDKKKSDAIINRKSLQFENKIRTLEDRLVLYRMRDYSDMKKISKIRHQIKIKKLEIEIKAKRESLLHYFERKEIF